MSLRSERKLGGVCKAGIQVTKTCKGPEVENSWTVREAGVTEQLEMRWQKRKEHPGHTEPTQAAGSSVFRERLKKWTH